MTRNEKLSIILSANNAAASLETLLPDLRSRFPTAEIIVVNRGSSDRTAEVSRKVGANLLDSPHDKGNGTAVKQGARASSGDLLALMDADGRYRPEDVERMLGAYAEGNFEMVVGARTWDSRANLWTRLANRFYNRLASWMVGQPVKDLTSRCRVVDGKSFRECLHLLPDGSSYPTTITMSFFRSAYGVAYVPVEVLPRRVGSQVCSFKDGLRFLDTVFKIGFFYSPLKFFLPISLLSFCSGVSLYIHTYFTMGRFTNMSALMFMTSLLVFLIGILSEQITVLIYQGRKRQEP